jgi:hypothetical protein
MLNARFQCKPSDSFVKIPKFLHVVLTFRGIDLWSTYGETLFLREPDAGGKLPTYPNSLQPTGTRPFQLQTGISLVMASFMYQA